MATPNDYQKAVQELRFARDKVRVVAGSVKQICDALSQWENADPKAINGTLEGKLKNWPTGDSVIAAIEDWKTAANRVQEAWDGQQDRAGLISPQDLKW